MLRNYLCVAWRNLWRHRLSAAVNLTVLSVALGYALLALTYVRQELTYDAFHTKAERIYQVHSHYISYPSGDIAPIPPDPDIGPALAQWNPSIQTYVRIRKELMDVGVSAATSDEWIPVLCADPEFLEVFDFPMVAGEIDSPLSAANSIVLTQAAVKRFFPSSDPLGKVINLFVRRYDMSSFGSYTLEPHPFTVTGVLQDLPPNSSLTFDLLIPYTAVDALDIHGISGIFLELAPGIDVEAVKETLPRFVAEQMRRNPSGFALSLQPLLSVHFDEGQEYDQLGENPTGRPLHLYILAGMALLILIATSLTYANLNTAHSLSRLREVGVRKTIGASPAQLWLQFWGESLLASLLALVIGLGLAWMTAGFFGELVNRRLDIFGNMPGDLVWFLGLSLFVGFAAGGYPALILARTKASAIVRGVPTDRGRRSFSRAMMVLQFGIAVFLVICVAVMGAQLLYMQNKDLGFDGDHVLGINLSNDHPDAVEVFRHALQQTKEVVAVSGADQIPARSYISATWRDQGITFDGFRVEEGFSYAMRLRLIAGRWFDPKRDPPSGAVVVNQAFVRRLGWSNPVGRPLPELPRPGMLAKWRPTIVGVIADFHNRDVQKAIAPAVLELQNPDKGFKYLVVRLAHGKVESGIDAVHKVWRQITNDAPFHAHILGGRLDAHRADADRWARLIRWSALLTLFIAGLSIFGLAELEAKRRTREIGIRKILGASVFRIVHLLLHDFSRWVLLANLFAWPAAYLAMTIWLSNFAYHITPGPQYFISAGLIGLIIVGLTASWHAVGAALANPTDSLRKT